MPKPLDEWLWKAMREWQMTGTAVNLHGRWHRGCPETYADCGTWLGIPFIRATAGRDAPLRNPWSNEPLRNGKLCLECFADELAMVESVWEARFGPSKGYTPPKVEEKEWVRF